jgi:hypothetical protein
MGKHKGQHAVPIPAIKSIAVLSPGSKKNIGLLKKAKRDCTCEGRKPHYHVLLSHDSESGDEYYETSDAKHHRLIERLGRQVTQILDRMNRLGKRK